MPVTARLSRLFYERFGDEIVGEMVDWFNQVDATYRGDLRKLNELNFASFDAKMEQRLAELRGELLQRVTELDAKLEQRLVELRAELLQRMAELEARFERRLSEQSRWLLTIFITLVATAIALWFKR